MAPSYYRVFALNRMYWLGGGLCRVAESTTTAAAAAAAAACAVEPKLSREQSTGRERETPLGSALRALASLLCACNTVNTRAAGRSENPEGWGQVVMWGA